MELSPQAVAAATFKTVKRGYDPDEVRAYLIEVSASLEASHQQATAMEARARAAIAKLQDATQNPQTSGAATPAASAETTVGVDDSATISRTLVLAQRTADAAIAEAQAEAQAIKDAADAEALAVSESAAAEAKALVEAANAEARTARAEATREAEAELGRARAEAERLVSDARNEAQRTKSESHLRAEAEVREFQSKRESLVADLELLEASSTRHRDLFRETSAALAKLADQVSLGGGNDTPRAPSNDHSSLGKPAGAAAVNGQSPITGQVPLQPGVEPLVSPRPTSAAEVRSMWHEAELADRLGDADDATPVEGLSADAPTPTDGILR